MNIIKSTSRRLGLFRAQALIWSALFAFHPASSSAALEIRNCSGTKINIEYQQASGTGSKPRISPVSTGASKSIATGSNLIGLKIYENNLVNTLRISVRKLNSEGTYSTVRMPNGRWQLISGSVC